MRASSSIPCSQRPCACNSSSSNSSSRCSSSSYPPPPSPPPPPPHPPHLPPTPPPTFLIRIFPCVARKATEAPLDGKGCKSTHTEKLVECLHAPGTYTLKLMTNITCSPEQLRQRWCDHFWLHVPILSPHRSYYCFSWYKEIASTHDEHLSHIMMFTQQKHRHCFCYRPSHPPRPWASPLFDPGPVATRTALQAVTTSSRFYSAHDFTHILMSWV